MEAFKISINEERLAELPPEVARVVLRRVRSLMFSAIINPDDQNAKDVASRLNGIYVWLGIPEDFAVMLTEQVYKFFSPAPGAIAVARISIDGGPEEILFMDGNENCEWMRRENADSRWLVMAHPQSL